MKRRGFLGLFAGALAGATLDPERALWISGAKTISIPKPHRIAQVYQAIDWAKPSARALEDYKKICAAIMQVPEHFFGDVSTGNTATAIYIDRPPELSWRATQLWK